MNATLNGKQLKPAVNHGVKKELIHQFVAIAINNGEWIEPITVRCYMGRSSHASVVYASIWLENGQSGSGRAGGYGYHISAAIDDAIRNAGIILDRDINSHGTEAVRDAIHSIANAMGYDNIHIVE